MSENISKDAQNENNDLKDLPLQETKKVFSLPGKDISVISARRNYNGKIHHLDLPNLRTETTRVRLLRGLLYVNETRNLKRIRNVDLLLVCRRFWEKGVAIVRHTNENTFNYNEEFSIINDEIFLKQVEKNYLQLEIWERSNDESNGNTAFKSLRPVGVIFLPLHQFYIAYKDTDITNHLWKGKNPVISFEAWAPIVNLVENKNNVSELKCVLAMGSDEQIMHLKHSRGLLQRCAVFKEPINNIFFLEKYISSEEVKHKIKEMIKSSQEESNGMKNSSNNLNTTLSALSKISTKCKIEKYSSQATGSQTDAQYFQFVLDITGARGLPQEPVSRIKKKSKHVSSTSQRFSSKESTGTYVTFKAHNSSGNFYTTEEGLVYATSSSDRMTDPFWDNRFHVTVTTDYLYCPRKHFMMKIWKKNALPTNNYAQKQPTYINDTIIGVVEINLSPLAQSQTIDGWFHIVDINERIVGQLQVRCQHLEGLKTVSFSQPSEIPFSTAASIDTLIDQFESTNNVEHLSLSHSVKDKYNELEDIAKRLRTRLADVTGQQMESTFNASILDNYKPIDLIINEEYDIEDFEYDINTVPNETRISPSLPSDNCNQNLKEFV